MSHIKRVSSGHLIKSDNGKLIKDCGCCSLIDNCSELKEHPVYGGYLSWYQNCNVTSSQGSVSCPVTGTNGYNCGRVERSFCNHTFYYYGSNLGFRNVFCSNNFLYFSLTGRSLEYSQYSYICYSSGDTTIIYWCRAGGDCETVDFKIPLSMFGQDITITRASIYVLNLHSDGTYYDKFCYNIRCIDGVWTPCNYDYLIGGCHCDGKWHAINPVIYNLSNFVSLSLTNFDLDLWNST